MRNKAIHINTNQRIARADQFCNGPLQNWDLNTHRPNETFRPQGMKPVGVLL
jgi:hypothetical protein